MYVCKINARSTVLLLWFKSILQDHCSGVYWSRLAKTYSIVREKTNEGDFRHHNIVIFILIPILPFSMGWIISYE